MTQEEYKQATIEKLNRRQNLLAKLINPARAAMNAMTDAGMHRTAEPLKEIFFELDALDQEMTELIKSNPPEYFINIVLGEK